MAQFPTYPPDVYPIGGMDHAGSMSVSTDKLLMQKLEQQIAAKIEAEASHRARNRLDDLLDALDRGEAYGGPEAIARDLKGVIDDRIQHHHKMIKTLEWFSAHVKLDAPEEGLLVARVIAAGLETLYSRKNRV